jgi:DNA-binding transcriptional LysR family regulator
MTGRGPLRKPVKTTPTTAELQFAMDNIQRGKLITVLDGMSGGELPVNLLWPRTPTLPARIRVVVDELLRNAP